MSVFTSFLILLCCVTYVCVLFLRWFALEFIYNNPGVMWSGCGMTLAVGTCLLVVVAIIAYFICRPFDSIVKKIKNQAYSPSEEDVKVCLSCYHKLYSLTIGANVFGFFIGQIILVAIGILVNGVEFVPSRVIFIVAQAVGFGLISLTTIVNILDFILTPYRQLLKIQTLSADKSFKTMDCAKTIALTVFAIVYFMTINMNACTYGYFFDFEHGTIDSVEISMLTHKGSECAFESLILCIPAFVIVLRGLAKRIKRTSRMISDIAEKGDLSKRIDIIMTDDFGNLTSSINTMIERFSGMLVGLKSGTDEVKSSAEMMADSAFSAAQSLEKMSTTLKNIQENSSVQNQLVYQADESISGLVSSVENVKKVVQEQAGAMETISSSITQMSANISSTAQIASKAQSVSEELSVTSVQGNNAVELAIKTMGEIQDAFEDVQSTVDVIQNISEQTNLLSMNAAIEAAHAGDVGKGFAVVADEVNKLAASSSESANTIQGKISEMLEKITAGVEAITRAGKAFSQIASRVEENGELVKQIFSAMEEQREGAKETQQSAVKIVESVQAINQLTQNETSQAESVHEFMQTVVEASKTTENAIQESLSATEDLNQTIKLVDDSAFGNKNFVTSIKQQVEQFKV